LRHVTRLGSAVSAERRTGEVAQLATGGVDALDPFFARSLPQVVLVCLVPPVVVARIWAADWLSGLVIVLTLPVVPLFLVLVGMATARRTRRRWRALERLA